LSTVAKEKGRAILATKPGQEAIVLEHGQRPAGVRLAFQVTPGSDLGELSARLSKAGIKSERRSGITPGIAQAIVFTDPKGTSVEIFSDYAFAKDDDNYTGVMPRKLGHVAFHTPHVAATVKFYCDVLGFKVSDWRSDFFAFLRRSRDHHTINLLQADNATFTTSRSSCATKPRSTAPATSSHARTSSCSGVRSGTSSGKHRDLSQESRRHHRRVLHRHRPDVRRGSRLFRAAAVAPGPPAAAEGVGPDTPTNYWGPGHPHDMPGPKK
jgi:catechol 2,3-dioxygenase-like lactoylglutathione lyase family enzyme